MHAFFGVRAIAALGGGSTEFHGSDGFWLMHDNNCHHIPGEGTQGKEVFFLRPSR
jgi:hypothetical protein